MSITEREAQQVDRANSSGKTAAVFIHGLWLLPSSWERWANLFEESGFSAVAASWPGDPDTFEQANQNPEVFAGKSIGAIAEHTAEVIGGLQTKPVLVGHSEGRSRT